MKMTIEQFEQQVGCKTDYQKMVLRELIYLVYEANPNSYGITGDALVEKRKELYGDKYGTLEERVLKITGYWSNDLEYELAQSTGHEGKIFEGIFDLLKDEEIKAK